MPKAVIQNGRVVLVGDDGKPLASEAQTRKNRPAGSPRKAAPAASQQKADDDALRLRRADRGLLSRAVGLVSEDAGNYVQDLGNRLETGLTLGLTDRLRSIGQSLGSDTTYAQARAAQKKATTGVKDRTGLIGDAVELGGGLAVPGIGFGGKAAARVYKAARGAGVGTRAARVASYVVPAAGAGASTGAITGALSSDDYTDVGQVARNTFNGTVAGGLGGAAFGVAAPFVSRVARRAARQFQGKAGRQALAREVREEAENEVLGLLQKQRITPKAADEAMEKMRAEGADPILADVTPAASMRLKTLNDNPNVTGSERVYEELGKRVDERGGRLRNRIGEITGLGGRAEARARQADIRKARLDKGKEQYAVGGSLDDQIHVSDNMHDILNGRNATTTIPGVASAQGADAGVSYMPDDTMRRAAANAIKTINANLDMPGAVRKVPNPKFGQPGELEETVVPTVRVMDEMLRSMRSEVNNLYRSGQTQAAAAVKSQMRALKEELTSANPDYADILKYQSQELAREEAHDVARGLAGKMFSNPRAVQHELGKIDDPDVLEEVRFGLVSHLIDQTSASPGLITKLSRSLRSGNQPEVKAMWDTVLGSDEKTKAFKAFLKEEAKSIRTDARVVGSQSITSAAKADANAADDMLAFDNVLAAGRAGVNAAAMQPAGAAANLGMIAKNAAGKLTQEADAVRKARQLRILLKRTDRGEMTRMARRNEIAQAKQTARRERAGRRAGRAAGLIGTTFTSPDNGE